jgi:dihydrofolate reductase
VVVTEVDAQVAGDTWAPPLGEEWGCARRFPAEGWLPSSAGLPFAVSLWTRRPAAPSGAVVTVLDDVLAAGSPAGSPVGPGR